MRLFQRVELVQQLAPVLLALVGDALGDHAFHREAGLRRVAAGGEGPVALAQKAVFGEAALRLGQHDVRRDQAARAGVFALEERDHRAGAWDRPAARPACGRSAPRTTPFRARRCRASCCG